MWIFLSYNHFHACLTLWRMLQVSKSDVEAALKVLNFAIYHKELTEMEEREQERERELKSKRRADSHSNESNRRTGGIEE